LFEALTPLSYSSVTVEQTTSGAVRLRVSEPGGTRVLVAGEYLHVRMPGNAATDLVGVSTVQRARGSLGLSLELNQAAMASANRSIGGYVIQAADTNTRSKRAKADDIANQTDGASDRFKPRILDPGAKFIPNTFSAADTELLASRQNAAQDVCLIFGMNPSMFSLLATSSYGSAAQAAEDFVVTCLGPLANRIEEAFGRCLLSDELRQGVFFEFSLDGILRSNPTDRFRQYEIGQRIKLYNQNDLRRMENLPPVEGGDNFEPSIAPAPEQTEPPIASAT
jgi:HK97 family phage portal protein